MFYLRTVDSYSQRNVTLGESYLRVNRDNQEEFEESVGNLYGPDVRKDCVDNIVELIISPDEMIPVYFDTYYYVMTESGKTFEKIYYPKEDLK